MDCSQSFTKQKDNDISKCVGCSINTIEPTCFDAVKNCKSFSSHRDGLKCSRCFRFLCQKCIKSIYLILEKIKNDLHCDCTLYYKCIEHYCKFKNLHPSHRYIGHCCMIDVGIDKEISNEDLEDDIGEHIFE